VAYSTDLFVENSAVWWLFNGTLNEMEPNSECNN